MPSRKTRRPAEPPSPLHLSKPASGGDDAAARLPNTASCVGLQWSLPIDPTKESPSEDTLVSAQTGNTSGVVRTTAASFTNAGANSAQLFRIVLKADNNSAAADKRGRVYLAASGEYK